MKIKKRRKFIPNQTDESKSGTNYGEGPSFDPLGSYTGVPFVVEEPIQDADDL